MITLTSKWELFNIDLSELPEGNIIIKTNEGNIHTNKELIQKAKIMAENFNKEINKELQNGTEHFKSET